MIISSSLVLTPTLLAVLSGDPPETWQWPLYQPASADSFETGRPRPQIWTSSGEFQHYGT